jgi:hypothetical protein
MDNFDLKKYLVENKVTRNSRMLREENNETDYKNKTWDELTDMELQLVLTELASLLKVDKNKYPALLSAIEHPNVYTFLDVVDDIIDLDEWYTKSALLDLFEKAHPEMADVFDLDEIPATSRLERG